MSLFPLLLMAGVGGYLYYFFYIKKRETDTPAMRDFYGYQPGETLDKMWPNGLLWLRKVSDQEKATVTAGNVAGLLLGFQVVLVFDTFALSLTTDGVFILRDNKKEGNIGTVRFRQADIRDVTRLHQENNLAASGVGKFEGAFDVELALKNGATYWIQIPESAYLAMTDLNSSKES
ncbi:hypothetical protein ACFSUS_02010 [Spirosoma soli]|uniref:Uncharacterized protein n=1 Tax=Spirosoma soli TaxID=1770529 RepID=A0ABW5LX63_9BACT